MDIRVEDHSEEVLEELHAAILKAAVECGMTAEGYAKKRCKVDTGLLRNSITFAVGGESPAISSYRASKKKNGKQDSGSYSGTMPDDEDGITTVYIGTNVEYAAYVELGTGKHIAGGRPDPWIYKDDEGKTHYTGGNRAQPFLKPAQ